MCSAKTSHSVSKPNQTPPAPAGGTPKQQTVSKDKDKKAEKHMQTNALAKDTYQRLMAQVEAVLNRMKPKCVESRFHKFDFNHPDCDLQDLLLGVEGFLDSMSIYEVEVEHQHLAALVYPKADEALKDYRKALQSISKTTDLSSAINVLKYCLDCLETSKFKQRFPTDLSHQIMSAAERAAYADASSAKSRSDMRSVQHDSRQLHSIVSKKLEKMSLGSERQAKKDKEHMLVDKKEMHDVRARHLKDQFL